ncbi:hypothetical protein EDD86DRAFT_212927 [Gorgonomyces haynaldii]|nr:hypothetical protein EDD86DRAFT_212927 [Gorgonomyces haynaldii]
MEYICVHEFKTDDLQLELGDKVTVFGQKGDWVLATFRDQVGLIPAECLIAMDKDPLSPSIMSPREVDPFPEVISLKQLKKMKKPNPCHSLDTTPTTLYFELESQGQNVLLYGNFDPNVKPMVFDPLTNKYICFLESGLEHGAICFYCFIVDDEWAVDRDLDVIEDADHDWNYFIVCNKYCRYTTATVDVLRVQKYYVPPLVVEKEQERLEFEIDQQQLELCTNLLLKHLDLDSDDDSGISMKRVSSNSVDSRRSTIRDWTLSIYDTMDQHEMPSQAPILPPSLHCEPLVHRPLSKHSSASVVSTESEITVNVKRSTRDMSTQSSPIQRTDTFTEPIVLETVEKREIAVDTRLEPKDLLGGLLLHSFSGMLIIALILNNTLSELVLQLSSGFYLLLWPLQEFFTVSILSITFTFVVFCFEMLY